MLSVQQRPAHSYNSGVVTSSRGLSGEGGGVNDGWMGWKDNEGNKSAMRLETLPDLDNPVPHEVSWRALTAAQTLCEKPEIDAITFILRREGKTTVQFTAVPLDNERPA
jgi:hypothetical protein